MKKPTWIRVFGWLSLAGIVLAVAVIVGGILVYRGGNLTAVGTLATGLGFWAGVLVAAPSLLVWAVSTIVWKVRASSVEARAGAMAQYYQQTRAGSPLGPRGSGTLDHVSVNTPRRLVTPARQTGSVFGLTLGQQPRIAHPAAAPPWPAQPAAETPPGPTDIPFRTAAPTGETTRGAPASVPVPSGAGGPAERSGVAPGEGSGGKSEPSVYTYEAPGLPLCPVCGVRPVIFYCRSHLKALCLECVVRHDRAGDCIYVPGWRGEKSEAH